MVPGYALLPIPDARKRRRRSEHRFEEVRALVRVLQDTVRGPQGERPSLEQIAGLVGITKSTLEAYCAKPRLDRARNPRGVPYATLYCIEALVSCPHGVADLLFGGSTA